MQQKKKGKREGRKLSNFIEKNKYAETKFKVCVYTHNEVHIYIQKMWIGCKEKSACIAETCKYN